LIHIRDTSSGTSPCLEVFFPLLRAGTIGGNDPNIVPFHIRCKKDMKNIATIFGIDKIAWKILVLWMLLYYLVIRMRINDGLARTSCACLHGRSTVLSRA